jgi:hypothetical protein
MDITKIKARFDGMGARSGYTDLESDRDYLRICGGVAWPFNGRPGFVVLIGEAFRDLRYHDPPVFYGIAESRYRIDEDMLSKCVELASIVDTWYSNTTRQAQYIPLHQFNQRQVEKNLRRIQLINVPMLSEDGDAAQLFSYADSELDKRTLGGRKTIFLAGCPQVQAALQKVPEGPTRPELILGLPEVTALYYALGAMFCFPFTIPSREPTVLQTDYDIFQERPAHNALKIDYSYLED